jgi:hypothetical protein
MELSDDQKKRILEEEQQRLAEEQYRTQVRQGLRNPTATNQASAVAAQSRDDPKRRRNYTRPLLLIILAIVAIVWTGRNSFRSAPLEDYAPSVIVSKHTEKIGTGHIVVNARKVFYYKLPIKDMRDIHVTGHFLALGGLGNDIDVVLAEEKEFGKWMDGQPAKVYYQSGKTTSGDIDAKLPLYDATYYLCFDNRFSVLSAKTINIDISLFYSTITLK